MDFFRVCTKESRKKGGPIEVYADYTVGRSKDLMVQGGAFYAVWDQEKGLWSRDEYDVALIVDKMLTEKVTELEAEGFEAVPKYLSSFDTDRWSKFKRFLKNVADNSHPLDTRVTFADTDVKKSDYASRRLPYSMGPGDITSYDTLVSRLYAPEEREKIEWAIGAVFSGHARTIEKFLVFYGSGGTGKSTIMNLIAKLFGGKIKDGGYVAFFDAQALTGNGNSFATEAFKDNPLVAIQHDGDLSKIESNARLNSIISHEDMKVNEKYKAQYDTKVGAMLFMGTNNPVQIKDAKSGLIRRLIDVRPTEDLFSPEEYRVLVDRLDFELGAIAHHCLQVYKSLGKNKYSKYLPQSMMFQTDAFLNFVDEYDDIFREQDGTTLKQAWEMYKVYCDDAELPFKVSMIKFREELKNYFKEFHDRKMIDGVLTRKVYEGFTHNQFKEPVKDEPRAFTLVMGETESILDEMYSGSPAQYGNAEDNPRLYWDDSERFDKNGKPFIPKKSQICNTTLGDLDTSKLHFVKVPEHHIVIDFDLTDDGEKSLELNLREASIWPSTYAEISKSGNGVHLHYIYDGDTSELANVYSEGIEIKVYRGNTSLRRKLTKCNNVAVATLSGGLPFKKEKPMQNTGMVKTEQHLRHMITKAMRKEFEGVIGTKSNVDFIGHLLREAKRSGMVYDVSDMKQKIILFANDSTNQAEACMKAVARMSPDFKSEITPDEVDERFNDIAKKEERIVFFDCEVYPNLFAVCWKYQGEGNSVVRMLNPTPAEIDTLLTFKLVGFNNRGYDNHILWARRLGASNEQLYRLSQRIIVEKDETAKFGGAWAASYADVYDFSVKKQGLKPWEIELNLPHVEMDIPWDQPVPDNKIDQVLDYCANDVLALEAVFNHLKDDFAARQILADLSGLSVNHSTRQHAAKIMFGNDREPQKKFVYTDLADIFPESSKGADDGYKFDEYAKVDKSWYRNEPVGEGGYVYAEPGMYENVALLDIESMHPTSMEILNVFGPYTGTFSKLKQARLAIKHASQAWKNGDDGAALEYLKEANELLPGVQVTKENAKALSDALKLVINSIYGYTSAKFMNPFRDKRNKDNIVAKMGALFMVALKLALQEQGVQVAHIKTDSVKIPNATPDIIAFIQEFGSKYGYTFKHEATYKKMCLVNDAVFIAYVGWNDENKPEHWKAVGAEFQHPYVFKTLFTDEPLIFKDLCETKQVKEGAMYLRFPEGDVAVGRPDGDVLEAAVLEFKDTHVGRSGMFVPINPDQTWFQGGRLLRIKDDKEYAVTGTKGYLWAEAEMIRTLEHKALERMPVVRMEDEIEGTGSIWDIVDLAYFNQLAEDAAQSIAKYGDFEGFVR